jgi:hypothetical protein
MRVQVPSCQLQKIYRLMKHLQTFQQLNEGIGTKLSAAFVPDSMKKTYELQIKTIDEVSKAILNSKELKDILAASQKENPKVKDIKAYFDLAKKSQDILKAVKSNGMSNKRKEAQKQVEALTKFAESLQKGFKLIKEFKTKVGKTLSNNEGLGTMIGNTLRNILTGKWIINMLSNIKSNLVDSDVRIKTIQDVVDINDY